MKKQYLITILLTVLMSMAGAKAFAYDIEVENADGITIYYNYINDGLELEVTFYQNTRYGTYFENTVIPEEVTYMNRTRKVTSIGSKAFMNSPLTSVTIPNSIISIEDEAFKNCIALTSIAIPNSVTFIGSGAFSGCSGLTSVSIPNSVTSIGGSVFYGCGGLTNVTIPNSINIIPDKIFYDCKSLTSINIPNNVTFIGALAFSRCSGLTSVTIPKNVTAIDDGAFSNCWRLATIIIPNSVTSIGVNAFNGCNGLTSVTIPNSVSSIGAGAFAGCKNLTTVISLIENPFDIEGKTGTDKTFDLDIFNNATLYVPLGTIKKYKNTEGWKDFVFIEEGTGPDSSGDTPKIKMCTKPTISYQNGKLIFICDTEGATCLSTITDTDITSYSSNEVQLGVTYHISVYATKDGYENSDVATATLCWIDVEPKTEGITNNVTNVRARAILIQSNGKQLIFSGVDEGTDIIVYDILGKNVGSAKVNSDVTTIDTSLRNGDIGIVKIGDKAIKVMIK